MIKKLLSVTFLVAAAGLINSYAQICTPDVTCIPQGTDYGICPDSAHGLPSGVLNVAYSQSLSIMTPATAAHWGTAGAMIDSMVVDSVRGLAPGLTYQCAGLGGNRCAFGGNTHGCILISGTPTQVWNHIITVYITPHVFYFTQHFGYTQATNVQYKSIVTAVAGIETLDLTKFEVEQNFPNPFSGISEIHYLSGSVSDVEFKVYNVLGAVVYADKYKAAKGSNTITLDAQTFTPGVYMYSLKNGDNTITKRMVVSGK